MSRADKSRVSAIARGECVECIAAVEIAVAAGDAVEGATVNAVRCGTEVYLMLGRWCGETVASGSRNLEAR